MSNNPTFNGFAITGDEGRFISGQSLSGRRSITIGGLALDLPSRCKQIKLGYSDGTTIPISESCLLVGNTVYDVFVSNAAINNGGGTGHSAPMLYLEGQCGAVGGFAPAGYYSDGGAIYYWDGGISANGLVDYGMCPRYARFSDITNLLDPGAGNTQQYQYTSSVSDSTAKYRFSYNTSPGVFVELYYKISTGAEYPNDLDTDSTPPKYQSNPFAFFNGATDEVSSGQYITLGFQSFNLSPGNPVEVVVEVKLPLSNTWYTWGSFYISTQ